MRVNVIGAGVAGLCAATELASRGMDVHLFDRNQGPGPDACSWWAGGMLAPWCERESAEEAVLRFGAESACWWDKHTKAVTQNGSLVVALGRDRSELKRFARRTSNYETLSAEAIAALEPDLGGRFSAGLYFPDEAHLSPRAVVKHLAQELPGRGATLHFRTDGAQAPPGDITLDCRGFAARDVLTDLRGVKGEMVVLSCPSITLSRPVRLLHPRMPLYVVPRGDGLFMVGATMIESEERERISVRSMLELLGAAYTLHPAFGEAQVMEIGVDVRPAFPDNLPRLRRRGDTLYLNGLYRHGFLLAPALARMAAETIADPNHMPEWMDENSL